ncbi:conjugal transfer protein TrbF [Mycobacterium sp. KBS0706]|uniref:conjugal transfer protein TrbF n=1 Tax=Mycobacterium sp. KBS0706 TaxID=2578109 RepID=UPI00110FF2F6|nr:conjugal transfer protein TrbF [Mycobacterium sp. KBS0706]TSD82770.1 conjugal transfer protein TrbF [Mycobacterium sp. KBS0706]
MNPFRRASARYGRTPEPVTPYQKAAQLWDERIGSARVQARNWRFMAFGCLGLAIGLGGGLIWQGAQSRIMPYVVEVDAFGQVRTVGPATDAYEPTDAQIAWHLGRFVVDVRSVPIDPVLLRRNWLEAYDFATERGAVFLNGHARAADPFKDVGEKSVSVQVTSVVRVSGRSFQVKWTEEGYERGSLVRKERWTAILTIVLDPPRSADVLRKNPLGLYVEGISWARELEPRETR